jgi:hypothetical protein
LVLLGSLLMIMFPRRAALKAITLPYVPQSRRDALVSLLKLIGSAKSAVRG